MGKRKKKKWARRNGSSRFLPSMQLPECDIRKDVLGRGCEAGGVVGRGVEENGNIGSHCIIAINTVLG